MQNPSYAKLCYHTDSFGKALIYCKTILIPLKENYVPGNINFYSINLWMVLWRPPRHFRTDTQKRCLFHFRGLGCKSRKSRSTWSNRQICPWSIEWSWAKANRVLPREYTGHSKHPLPKTQEKTLHMDRPDGQYQNQNDYILCSQIWRSSIESEKIILGADWLRSWTLYCQIQTEIEESGGNH